MPAVMTVHLQGQQRQQALVPGGQQEVTAFSESRAGSTQATLQVKAVPPQRAPDTKAAPPPSGQDLESKAKRALPARPKVRAPLVFDPRVAMPKTPELAESEDEDKEDIKEEIKSENEDRDEAWGQMAQAPETPRHTGPSGLW